MLEENARDGEQKCYFWKFKILTPRMWVVGSGAQLSYVDVAKDRRSGKSILPTQQRSTRGSGLSPNSAKVAVATGAQSITARLELTTAYVRRRMWVVESGTQLN